MTTSESFSYDLLKVFTSGKVDTYIEVLRSLDETLFWDGSFCSKQDAVKQITKLKTSTPSEAQVIYRELEGFGWLREHHVGVQKFVDINPIGLTIIDFLDTLSHNFTETYKYELLQINALLLNALGDDDFDEDNVHAAAISAKKFLSYIRVIAGNLADINRTFKHEVDSEAVLDAFFNDYLGKFINDDFIDLNRKNNPFRHKQSILNHCEQISLMDDVSTEARASAKRIEASFKTIDIFLEAIEETTSEIEQRTRNTIKFIDEIRDFSVGDIKDAMEALVELQNQADLWTSEIPALLPESEIHLFSEKVRAQPIKRSPIVKPEENLASKRHSEAIKNYFDRTNKSFDHVNDVLLRSIPKNSSLQGSSFTIDNLDDFFVFQKIRTIDFNPSYRKNWSIERLNTTIKNDWITCRDFVISRREENHDR